MEDRNLILQENLKEKANIIKGLLEDAEIPDEYKQHNIKCSLNEIIRENKAIVDDALEIHASISKETTGMKGKYAMMFLKKEDKAFATDSQKLVDSLPSQVKNIIDISLLNYIQQ